MVTMKKKRVISAKLIVHMEERGEFKNCGLKYIYSANVMSREHRHAYRWDISEGALRAVIFDANYKLQAQTKNPLGNVT